MSKLSCITWPADIAAFKEHMLACSTAEQGRQALSGKDQVEYLTCAGHSDWHGSQALGSCHLEELSEAAPLCWLSWHSVNKGLNILDKQRTNMPFPTASSKKRVTGLQACSDSVMPSFFSLSFSHAQWNKWFRWEECSWKEPCTHRYLFLAECKGNLPLCGPV